MSNVDGARLCAPIDPAVLERHGCPLCGGTGGRTLARRCFPGVSLTNVICRTCGLIRIDPRPSEEWYRGFYSQDFFSYLRPYERPAYVEEIERTTQDGYQTPTLKNVVPFFIDYVKPGGRVLDIGAGFGAALYHLRKLRGCEVVGIEPDPYSRQVAREKIGIELIDDELQPFLSRAGEKFDCIVMDQVFEHLLEPLRDLKLAAEALSPEGILYVSVPNAYNPFISMDLFYQVAHTYNYTPHVLAEFARRAGLKVVKVSGPLDYPLSAVLARADSSYPAVPGSQLAAGGDWRQVCRRLRAKRLKNVVRGYGKRAAAAVLGRRGAEALRAVVDRLTRYRY